MHSPSEKRSTRHGDPVRNQVRSYAKAPRQPSSPQIYASSNTPCQPKKSTHTSLARARQQHRLEPRRKVVHDREVARRDAEVAHAHEDGDALPEEEGREDRLGREPQLDVHEQQRERERGGEGGVDRWGGPLEFPVIR